LEGSLKKFVGFCVLSLGVKKFVGLYYFLKNSWEMRAQLQTQKKPNSLSIDELVENFRGIRVWNHISRFDWVLYSQNLYAENLILIGGHRGKSVSHLLQKIPGLARLHVYEPIQEYADEIAENILDPRVLVYREAIFNGEDLTMSVGGDGSLIDATKRTLPPRITLEYKMSVKSVKLSDAVERIRLENQNSHFTYTVFMNCEGSEYEILSAIDSLNNQPKSIFIQNHTATKKPFVNLFKLRMQLSEFYYPLVSTNWAWDIWVRNDYISKTISELEQDPVR
jgi:FkbM family methyltransferase